VERNETVPSIPVTPCPWYATTVLSPEAQWPLREDIIFRCGKWDAQCRDHPIMAPYALILDDAEWTMIKQLAGELSAQILATEYEILQRPELHVELGIPQPIRNLLRKYPEEVRSSGIRLMRYDFHFTTQGWRISEVNADVPGGFLEASDAAVLIARHYPAYAPTGNTCTAYAEAIHRLCGTSGYVGLVHATCHTDDRQVMECLSRHLQERGLRTVILSPSHLRWAGTTVSVEAAFATGRLDCIIRHYPAEWLPLLPRRECWTGFFRENNIPKSNPGQAILLQTKRLPLVWNKLHTPVPTWRALLPESQCPSRVSTWTDEWVVKPALGRVGEDVAIAGVTPITDLQRIRAAALRCPRAWVAQRRFQHVPISTPDGQRFPCLGVFTVGTAAVGAYGRVSRTPLVNGDAQDVAVLIAR
jgi:glutathionylspermidine synthase